MAEALTSLLTTRQAKVIEERRDVTPSSALRQASEHWELLSCHLLTAGWLGLAHCAKGIDMAACQTRRPAQPADNQAVPATLIDESQADSRQLPRFCSERGRAALTCTLRVQCIAPVCSFAAPTRL